LRLRKSRKAARLFLRSWEHSFDPLVQRLSPWKQRGWEAKVQITRRSHSSDPRGRNRAENPTVPIWHNPYFQAIRLADRPPGMLPASIRRAPGRPCRTDPATPPRRACRPGAALVPDCSPGAGKMAVLPLACLLSARPAAAARLPARRYGTAARRPPPGQPGQ
jgi:hypothetical protein